MWKHWPVASRYSELLQQFKLVLTSGLPHATTDSTTTSNSSSGDSYAVWCDAIQSLRSFGLPWAQVIAYTMHGFIIISCFLKVMCVLCNLHLSLHAATQ
jgi:hypothetical protein